MSLAFPLRHRTLALAASFLVGARAALAAQDVAPVSACLAPAVADTLERAVRTRHDARAYWLTRDQLQWPGAPVDGQYALYHASRPTISVTVGARVNGADGRVALVSSGSTTLPTAGAERFRFVATGARLSFPAGARIDIARLLRAELLVVREDANGNVLDATGAQLPGALDDIYAAADSAPDLGATLSGNRASFALWAPTARAVTLCLFNRNESDATVLGLARDDGTGIWRGSASSIAAGTGYLYLVDVMVPGVGLVRNRVTDPYSIALTANSTRSVVVSLGDPRTQPRGWRTRQRPPALRAATDLTVYELHIRDFSAQDASVRAGWRGKYLAFTEPASAGMRHLRALRAAGVTDLHLLPAYDLSSIPEVGCVIPTITATAPNSPAQQAAVSAVRERDCFNWGYDPWHYTVPEGSYATTVTDPMTRIREFRAMVLALHSAGLRVGMDVVYNHTFAAGQDAKSVLDRVVPGYYHRLNAEGAIERSTCCENTATEHRMMAKLMIESAVTWVRHYGIDSFRFDLMGHQPRAVMEQLQRSVDRAASRHVPLLGEGWNFGEVANGARFVQASQLSLGGSGIGTFSDRARDALRGGGCCDSGEALVSGQGLLNGLGYAPNAANQGRDRRAELVRAADLARVGLAGTLSAYEMTAADGVRRPLSQLDYAGQPAGYAQQPGEVVNYVENHDNLTLFDLNALRLPRGTSREDRARVQVLGIAFTLLSQGIAYLHAGSEILRSKSLDRDSYDSGDWFNRLDWTYRSNGFGAGLPPAHRNEGDWPVMRPVLADTSITPASREIRWTRDASLDLLRIRSSSTLFRLRTTADVRERLSFRNVGPSQDPLLLVGHLNGVGYPGARFREVLYLVNVSEETRELVVLEEAGKRWVLHPVHRSPKSADRRAANATVDVATGRFEVPGRTAVVFVLY